MPVRFTENDQKLIGKLIKYFTRERNAGKPLLPVTAVHNRVADALESSIKSVEKIAAEGIQRDSDYKIKVHAGHVSARGAPLYKVHEHAIRSRVYAMYSAVKLWGNEGDTAVLTVHGVMDNAGSFDGIIPLLPKYFYVCVDLPGHGKSSHFPPRLPIHTIDYIIVYKLVLDYFKREKYIIMGHSYGGQIGLLFAQIYPQRVEKLIMLDTVHMLTIPTKYFKQFLEERFDRHCEMEKRLKTRSAPQYTYQEAFNKLMQVRPTEVTEKVVTSLLQRMLIPVGNGKFELSLDQRLKYFLNPLQDNNYVIQTLRENPVNCPVLMVFGRDNGAQRHILRPILNHLKKQRNVTVKYVRGDHDVHQVYPERVAPHVDQFLNNQKMKLWGNEDDPAVLTVHGIMDNAGSFDGIIPLLPKYFYICVDLPGHGKSTHFPPHLPIHTINYIIVYKLVMDYFKREKYIIIGHSYGGQIGLLFAQIYPQRVEKLIMLDTVHMFTIPSKYFKRYLEERFNRHSEVEQKMKTRSPPQYTYQEAINKIIQVRPTDVTEKVARALLQRMLVPVGNDRFELSMDQRLKYVLNPPQDIKYVIETLKENPVLCPILMVFGLDSNAQRQVLRPILNHLKKQRNVTVKYVQGDHDVHQVYPEKVAPHVEQFLNNQKSKL